MMFAKRLVASSSGLCTRSPWELGLPSIVLTAHGFRALSLPDDVRGRRTFRVVTCSSSSLAHSSYS